MATAALRKASKEAIIETLKNDEQYYGDFGKAFLSNSDIDTLLNNPKDYGKSRPDSKALIEGRYFHQLLIEPEKAAITPFVDASTRNTNIYKEFLQTTGMPFCLLKKEGEDMRSLVSSIKGNIAFYDEIYRTGNQYEVPEFGEIHGRLWKGKADIVTEDCIIDLKTTSDIASFKWSARKYNYDSQCYIYQALFGKPLVFYVADKETHQLGIFRPTESFVKGGEQKVIRAIEAWKKYFGPDAAEDVDNHYIDEYLE